MKGFYRMKTISIFVVGLLTTSLFASEEVLFCFDDDAVGFDPIQNYKVGNYEERRFKIKVDFDRKSIISPDLFFSENLPESNECVKDIEEESLYCINKYGTTLNVNLNTMKYYRAAMLIDKNTTDDAVLTYGTCERFWRSTLN